MVSRPFAGRCSMRVSFPMSTDQSATRRRMLFDTGAGFGWLALSWLSGGQAASAAVGQPHFPPKVKRVVQVFCVGGMSHLDTFDYKPQLSQRNGQPFNMPTFFGQAGSLLGSVFPFQQRGQSGLWVSDLLPNLAQCADKLTIIRTMVAKSANHMPAVAQMNTGFIVMGFPAMGAWVTYGLGTENQNLPAYVVLTDPNGQPWGGSVHWSNSFLPASAQGTAFRSSGDPVPDLATPPGVSAESRRAGLGWLEKMNSEYAEAHHGESAIEARVRSYEVAASMQL